MVTLPRLPWHREPNGYGADMEGGSAFITEHITAPIGGSRWGWSVNRAGKVLYGAAPTKQRAADAATQAWHNLPAVAVESAEEREKREREEWIDRVEQGGGIEGLDLGADYERLYRLMDTATRRWKAALARGGPSENLDALIATLSQEFYRRRMGGG